ncbi:hypothetical protein B0J11DRAFT_510572 [Dendryphion nanum]|uniref:Uncharacterized protein n=1 Tax=Dendryphion nanum TaxID=256645 RepID=A0A9P9DC36_9PLEO|nr:hypothetical protein B0J11DRAFT_510572 [Dendryphion nanum]
MEISRLPAPDTLFGYVFDDYVSMFYNAESLQHHESPRYRYSQPTNRPVLSFHNHPYRLIRRLTRTPNRTRTRQQLRRLRRRRPTRKHSIIPTLKLLLTTHPPTTPLPLHRGTQPMRFPPDTTVILLRIKTPLPTILKALRTTHEIGRPIRRKNTILIRSANRNTIRTAPLVSRIHTPIPTRHLARSTAHEIEHPLADRAMAFLWLLAEKPIVAAGFCATVIAGEAGGLGDIAFEPAVGTARVVVGTGFGAFGIDPMVRAVAAAYFRVRAVAEVGMTFLVADIGAKDGV